MLSPAQYTIVYAETLAEFMSKCSDLAEEGWLPVHDPKFGVLPVKITLEERKYMWQQWKFDPYYDYLQLEVKAMIDLIKKNESKR